jgi:pimeloyl-ACP methyl ester carboxylesterase
MLKRILGRRCGNNGGMSPAPGVPAIAPPRLEGTVALPDGRRLGYAEFGDPNGPLVLWFHGTPGGRRQVPPLGRRTAAELGLRVVCIERPGAGDSTDHAYRVLREFAGDLEYVVDQLGHDRFAIVALSGGGPYALACAHDMPDRVIALGILGGLVPTTGPEAAAGGIVALTRPFNPLLTAFRRSLGRGLWAFVRGAEPVGHYAYRAYMHALPHGDDVVLADPELEAMFIDDLNLAARRRFHAFVNDLVLVGRPWGFSIADVRVPVRWWHGDADPFVALDQAQRTVARLRDVKLTVRHDESHLGGFAVADEVLRAMAALCKKRPRPQKAAK